MLAAMAITSAAVRVPMGGKLAGEEAERGVVSTLWRRKRLARAVRGHETKPSGRRDAGSRVPSRLSRRGKRAHRRKTARAVRAEANSVGAGARATRVSELHDEVRSVSY